MTAPVSESSVFRVVRGTSTSRAATVLGLLLCAALVSLPAWGGAATMKLLIEMLTLLALAQMWNLMAGYGGLVSIGQQAFVGLGAYGLYVLSDLIGLEPFVAIPIIAAVVGIFAWGTSFFVFRLEGGYFAIGTWVIAEVVRIVVSNTAAVGAGTGVSIQSLAQFGAQGRITVTYILAVIVGLGSILVVAVIMRSRLGLALRATRDSDIAARSLGVDVFRTKLAVYLIASVGCAVTGAVIYMNLLRIQPNAAFGVEWSARMIFIVLIGGLGSIEGPILGTLIFIGLREALGDFGSSYLIVLGAVAIVFTLVAPRGLWGLITRRLPVTLITVQQRLVRVAAVPSPVPGPEEPDRR